MNTIDNASKILEKLMRLKPNGAEVYLRTSGAFDVEVKEQKVEALDASKNHGIGLRILIDGRMGFGFTSDLGEDAIENLIRTVFSNTKHIKEDRYAALPERDLVDYSNPSIFDDELVRLTEKERIEKAMILEKASFDYDRRIKKARKASFSIAMYETTILSSKGIKISYKGTSSSVSIMAVAEERGDSQMAYDYSASPFLSRLDIENVGRNAAEKAVEMLGAKRVSSVMVPVILDNGVAAEFLSVIAPALSADSIQKGRSLFAEKLGMNVASPLITIIDDGLLQGGIATAPSDDEGIPMKRKVLIDKGTLKGFFHNTYTARKDGTVSTGNCIRGGFRGIPGVGITNLYINKGEISRDSLIKDLKKGFYIRDAMGVHTANPISGDFSIGVSGLWIENGCYAYPVREAVISGNIIDLMKKIDAVADDIRFYGRIGSPSLRIPDVDISGGS